MQLQAKSAPPKGIPPDEVCFDVYGDFACFSVPALRTEHYSYDVPTPSAICGIAKAIYWHPSFDYEAVRCEVFNPIQKLSITQNELNAPAKSSAFFHCMESGGPLPELGCSEVRQQKTTTLLKDVYYRVTVRIIPRQSYSGEEKYDLNKIKAILTRRIEKGQQYHTPHFGIRECTAYVSPPDTNKKHVSFYQGVTASLGTMLYGIQYVDAPDGTPVDEIPHFFNPVMVNGVIEFPRRKEVF